MAQYIIDYITEEVSRYRNEYGDFDIDQVISQKVYGWIRRAVEAYEGGAR